MIYYTGIGARKSPPEILVSMMVYGTVFAKLGDTLRSGGAAGADQAFERGCDVGNGLKEIYLPWKGFNNHPSHYHEVHYEAMKIAEDAYGSRWKSLSSSVKKLMTRNVYQILGINLNTPSSLVICWTPDGARTSKDRSKITGGTGQAITCASHNDIPVFNLKNAFEEDMLLDFVGGLDE